MPQPSAVMGQTDFEIDRDAHTIRFIRSFDASRADVFDAWTMPEHVSCWWDAAREPLLVCEIDLRVGGGFKFATKAHPDMVFAGIYREISRPDRLVFEAIGSTGRIVFREVAGKTRMTVEIECRSAGQLEEFVKMGVATGTSQTLDNLVAYMQRRSRGVA